jgi:polyphosphate:AMP phosphotransferase
MLEAAEIGNTVPKEEYIARVPQLRAALLSVQRELSAQGRFPVIIVFAGVDGGGKSETVNLLNEWMDPRWIVTRAFGDPTEEEQSRPEFWRYWQALPPRGRVGLFLRSWYSPPILERVHRRIKRTNFEERLNRIVFFEKALADEGAVILKFWMHLGRAAQKKRLKQLERDPLTRWRVTARQWKNWYLYDRFVDAAERVIARTSTDYAPWTIIEGDDERYRNLTVSSIVCDAIRKGLADRGPASSGSAGAKRQRISAMRSTVLSRLDMSHSVDRSAFRQALEEHQGRLNVLYRKARQRGISVILVFEGWDAAGKGGAIRRVTAALDAASYQIVPIAAPTDEERAHHYLWRFWRHLPRAGTLTIFDRSWYGRVLVERVEGFASPAQWLRAYSEINQFEEQLVDHGIVVVKYWLHISREEQLRRFRERRRLSFKQWKLTDEDWRNRRKWNEYQGAVNEMFARTSTRTAPWTLVEANDKYYARLKVLKVLSDRLKVALRSL